jgi:hypothetical protein
MASVFISHLLPSTMGHQLIQIQGQRVKKSLGQWHHNQWIRRISCTWYTAEIQEVRK